METTLTRTFRPNENGFGFLGDTLSYQSPLSSRTTQDHSQGQSKVRNIHAERLGRPNLLQPPQPQSQLSQTISPPFLINQGQVQQGNLNVNVQVSSSHTYMQQEKGFPVELCWQVKKHIKDMVENPYEKTLQHKIQMLRDGYIMFWQRVKVYVRHGWMRSLVVAFGLVGKEYKKAGTILYKPVVMESVRSNGRCMK